MPKATSGAARRVADRTLICDPGLIRLRSALFTAILLVGAVAVEYGYAHVIHARGPAPAIAITLGVITSLLGGMALSGGSVPAKIRTAVFFPVAIGLGLLLDAAAGAERVGGFVQPALFVAVLFVAVYVRRFDPALFFHGFMFWIGYFVAGLLHASYSALPALLYDVLVATGWVLLMTCTVLRTHPGRALRRVDRASGARVRAIARAAARLLEADRHDPWRLERERRRLHRCQHGFAETVLIIEGWAAEAGALPRAADAILMRRRTLDAHLAIDSFCAAAEAMVTEDDPLTTTAARVAEALAGHDHGSAWALARLMLDAEPASGTARHLASSVIDYITLVDDPRLSEGAADPDDPPHPPPGPYTPAVALNAGALPGSVAVAAGVKGRGHRWNPFSRLPLSSRQAIQVAITAAIAVLLGRELSQARYYWALIAAFFAFAGTSTRSETVMKALQRVAGTVVGIVAGLLLADLTSGHTYAVLAVVVVALSGGAYLMPVSYAGMVFFVTITVSQTYGVLHELSWHFLVLRLEETAIGAGAGIVVALVVIPTGTRDTVDAARRRYFAALADLLAARGDDAGAGAADREMLERLTRTLDHRLQQTDLVARPLTRPPGWRNDPRMVRHRMILLASAVRHARALALAPRDRLDPRGEAHLATACRGLAEAAAVLAREPAAPSRGRPAHDVAAPLAAVDDALYADGTSWGGEGEGQVSLAWRISRLRQLLHELALPPGVFYAFPAAGTDPPASRCAAAMVALDPFVPVAAPEVRGQVLDEAGQPLAVASLAVWDASGQEVAGTSSLPDGRFTLPAPVSGDYLLTAAAEHHLAASLPLRVRAGMPDVQVRLRAFGAISGVVRDSITGAGVPGAWLAVTDAGRAQSCSTRTASDGAFCLDGLAADRYTLILRAPGYRAESVLFDMPVAEPGGSVWWELWLEPEHRLPDGPPPSSVPAGDAIRWDGV